MKILKSVILLSMTSLLAACGGSGESGDGSESGSASSDKPTIEVSAKDLSSAFQENEVRAKAEYDGKNLLVTGKIKDVALDMFDKPEIKLGGANDALGMGVNEDGKMTDVSVSGLSTEVAAKLNKGETLKVVCSEVSEVMGSAMLRKCKPAPDDTASAE